MCHGIHYIFKCEINNCRTNYLKVCLHFLFVSLQISKSPKVKYTCEIIGVLFLH